MAQPPTIDIARIIDEQKIGRIHITLIVLSFLTLMVDGYDIIAVGFAGPSLVKEWGATNAQLGILFTSGLFAGLFGSLICGYLADRFGRKRVIVYGLLFFGVFTLASVLADSISTLTLLRFIAGLGVGGVMPVVFALNSEYAPRRIRATLMLVMSTGTTFGGVLPGLVSAQFLARYGWHILFWTGGLGPILVAIVVAYLLPESIKYLSLRPERRGQLVEVLRRFRPGLEVPPDARVFISGEENRPKFAMKNLFAGRFAILTPLFWAMNAFNLTVYFFLNQWMPTILSYAGIPAQRGALAVAVFQVGGTLAVLSIMRFLDWFGYLPIPFVFAAAIPVIACLGIPGLPESAIFVLLFLAGFCLLSVQSGGVAMQAIIYPTYIRGWGVASCMAAGRFGLAGPLIGGMLMSTHMPMQQLFLIVAVPMVIGLVVSAIITPLYRKEQRGQHAQLAPFALPAK